MSHTNDRQAHLDFLPELLWEDNEILQVRDRKYDSSWLKRGGVGVFMNLGRKWDRLENAVTAHGYNILDALRQDESPDGIIDDLRDLRHYTALTEALLRSLGFRHPFRPDAAEIIGRANKADHAGWTGSPIIHVSNELTELEEQYQCLQDENAELRKQLAQARGGSPYVGVPAVTPPSTALDSQEPGRILTFRERGNERRTQPDIPTSKPEQREYQRRAADRWTLKHFGAYARDPQLRSRSAQVVTAKLPDPADQPETADTVMTPSLALGSQQRGDPTDHPVDAAAGLEGSERGIVEGGSVVPNPWLAPIAEDRRSPRGKDRRERWDAYRAARGVERGEDRRRHKRNRYL